MMQSMAKQAKRLFQMLLLCIALSSYAQANRVEIQISDAELEEILSAPCEKNYVFIGTEASNLMNTLQNIANLAEQDDAIPALRNLAERTAKGYKTALKEIVLDVLEHEAEILLEKHHNKIKDDADLEALIQEIASASQIIRSDALTIITEEPTR